MMFPDWIQSLSSVVCIASMHLFIVPFLTIASRKMHSIIFSIGNGIALSYVFLDVLPKLAQSDRIVSRTLQGILPYVERHAYVMALFGFLFFYFVQKQERSGVRKKHTNPLISLTCLSYSLFQFLVGYAVADKNDPEVQPLILFTLSISLHFFTSDYTFFPQAGESVKQRYIQTVLILFLFSGWFIGSMYMIPKASIALVSAFIGGGVIMNVIGHEIPEEKPNSSISFLMSTIGYSIILLSLGS